MMLWNADCAMGAKNLHTHPRLQSLQQRDFTYAAVYTCDPMISPISSETLVDPIFVMARKILMHYLDEYFVRKYILSCFFSFVLTNMHCARCVTTFFVVSETEASKWWMKTTWGRKSATLCFRIWWFFSRDKELYSPFECLEEEYALRSINFLFNKLQSQKVLRPFSRVHCKAESDRQSRWAQQHFLLT
jgi:hypothetical protein